MPLNIEILPTIRQNAKLFDLAAKEATLAGKNGQTVEVSKVGKDVTVKVLPPKKDDVLTTTSE